MVVVKECNRLVTMTYKDIGDLVEQLAEYQHEIGKSNFLHDSSSPNKSGKTASKTVKIPTELQNGRLFRAGTWFHKSAEGKMIDELKGQIDNVNTDEEVEDIMETLDALERAVSKDNG